MPLFTGCDMLLADLTGTAPDPPSPIEATQNRETIHLSWSDFADTEAEYIVERRINGGGWETVAVVDADTTRYIDNGTVSGTYAYRITAVNEYGEGASRDFEVVYDGILGKTVSTVSLPFDSDG
ncbi:MAG: fibronectin type III domain-containing protein, partial [Alkalispirochaeta sp.]